MRTRLSTYLALALLTLGWVSVMLSHAPGALDATIRVLRHAFN